MLLSAVFLFTGCVSSKYREAKKDTPPPQLLNVAFAPAPLQAMLNTVITYNGPGSWKRNAFWDEYVITLHNPSRGPITVSAAQMTDFSSTPRAPGSEPWTLEKESKTLEQKYKEAGIAFVRYTAPGLIIAGAGVGFGSAALMSAGAANAAAVCLVALPVYYISVLTINHHNKVAMEKEFNRRRLILPLTLAPGETRTGSFFFPMIPSPRSLNLDWSDETGGGGAVLTLDFLRGLHVKTTTATPPDSPRLPPPKPN